MVSEPPIGDVLREACDAWGLDAGSLAARASVSVESVAEAMRGEADVGDLDAIARALGGTLDDLLTGRRFWVAPTVAFKSAPGEVEAPLVRSAILRLASVARDRATLTSLLGLYDPVRAGRSHFAPLAPSSDVVAQAEALALRVRSHLGNGQGPILSVRELMGSLGVWTFLSDFGVDEVDGLLWRDEDGRACAAANTRARGGKLPALRMTFVHELCHALFDGTRGEAYGLVEGRAGRGDAVERRANAFAAHLLAPRASVDDFLASRGLPQKAKPTQADVRALSDHFQMGVEAMANHLVSCHRWERSDARRYPALRSRDAIGPDNRECHPAEAEALVPIERRGDVLEYATLALERGEISVGRWREFLRLRRDADWRDLLDEGFDAEHRCAS